MHHAGWSPSDVLGLPEDASFHDIKRAYFRRARTTHPDAPGGSAEAFRRVQAAFDTLKGSARSVCRPAGDPRPPAARPAPYDLWTAPIRPIRQWLDDDPLLIPPAPIPSPQSPSPRGGRPPSFAEVLASVWADQTVDRRAA